MTREEFLTEIQAMSAFSKTWTIKYIEVDWEYVSHQLLAHYMKGNEEVSKADLLLFDELYHGFSEEVLSTICDKKELKSIYMCEIAQLRKRTNKKESMMFYSYDACTGAVEDLGIIVRGIEYKEAYGNLENHTLLEESYEFFKYWLFVCLAEYGIIPGFNGDKPVYYIANEKWKSVCDKYSKWVQRLKVGTEDICKSSGYYGDKKAIEEYQALIDKLDNESDDTKYVEIPYLFSLDKYKKLCS